MGTAYLFLGLIEAAFSLSLFFLVLALGGWQWSQPLVASARLYHSATGIITLSSILLMQVGNGVARRSLRDSGLDRGLAGNRLLLLGIAAEVLFSWAILFLQPVQGILQTGPVDWRIYAAAWLGIPLLFGLDLLRKRVAAARERSAAP